MFCGARIPYVNLCNAAPDLVKQLENKLRDTFSMRIPVRLVDSLPRFEFKAKRWVKA